MAINRVLYATQTARLFTYDKGGSQLNAVPWVLAVQTASADETIPQDDVLVMGKLGGAARLQKDVATSKASLKAFIVSGMTVKDGSAAGTAGGWYAGVAAYLGGASGAAHANGQNALLASLEDLSLLGKQCRLTVDSTGLANAANNHDGFQMDGICSNISIDASKGAFPTLDIAMEGVGTLLALNMGTAGTLADQHGGVKSIATVVPLTSTDVVPYAGASDTIASSKFSYDMPTEVLSALGGQIVGNSTHVAASNVMFSKPPFKVSLSADGQGLENVAANWGTSAGIYLRKAGAAANSGFSAFAGSSGLNISTKSFSQNVGDVGATFNVSAEGTKAFFTIY